MASDSRSSGLKIFLSYASELAPVAERVYLTLNNSGHDVFFDRTSIPPGTDYNPTILSHLRASDLMIFLISPGSVEEGAYARTELRFARDVWPDPAGHVLPVMAVPTALEKIPNYLRAISILTPEGNVAAEVAAAVHNLATGYDPAATVAGQRKLLDEAGDRLRQLALENLERSWQEKRKTLLVKINGLEYAPTSIQASNIPFWTFAIGGAFVAVVPGFFLIAVFAVTRSFAAACTGAGCVFLFVSLPSAVIIGVGFLIRNKIKSLATEYERTEHDYQQAKSVLLGNQSSLNQPLTSLLSPPLISNEGAINTADPADR